MLIKKNKLVFSVGINDADYPVTEHENGKRVWMCPYYQTWASMIRRSYSCKFKQERPTYEGVTVCEEWWSFMCFRKWMIQQDWDSKCLDKDILFEGNKVYCPDTCVFVDGVVNSFILDCTVARGELPVGVCWNKRNKKFQSQCSNPFSKKKEYLGSFNCPNEAHEVWKKRKYELACQLADMQTDNRVAEALRTRFK